MKSKTKKNSSSGVKTGPTFPEQARRDVSELIRQAGCGEITLERMCDRITAITLMIGCPPSEFEKDVNHFGPMTVRDLVRLVLTDEFPNRLKTAIKVGDVEGNLGVNGNVCVMAHKPGDIVIAVDMHGGDMDYDCES